MCSDVHKLFILFLKHLHQCRLTEINFTSILLNSSNGAAPLLFLGEERSEPEVEALDLPVDQRSNPQLKKTPSLQVLR